MKVLEMGTLCWMIWISPMSSQGRDQGVRVNGRKRDDEIRRLLGCRERSAPRITGSFWGWEEAGHFLTPVSPRETDYVLMTSRTRR